MKHYILLILFFITSSAIAQSPTPPPGGGGSVEVPDIYMPPSNIEPMDNLGRVKEINASAVPLTKNSTIDRNQNFLGIPSFPKCTDCSEGETGITIKPFDITVNKGTQENYISSPFTNFREAIRSKKFAHEFYAKEMAQSELALTTATWAMVEPAFFSAMSTAGSTALSLSQNRYLADQSSRALFASNKHYGDVLAESYNACIAMHAQRSGYLAAQEICLGGMEKNLPTKIGDDTELSGDEFLSFAQHPFHPSNTDIEFFDGDIDPDNPNSINLTHLIFSQAFLNVPAMGDDDDDYENYLKGLVIAWRDLFGDIKYSMEKRSKTALLSSLLTLNIERQRGTFVFPDNLGGAEYAETVNKQVTEKRITPFKAYMRYKTDATYYNLVRLLYKYCLYSFSGSPSTFFWNPEELPSSTSSKSINSVTVKEITSLSTRSYTFNSLIGNQLLALYTTTFGSDISRCESLNVTEETADTSLKSVQDNVRKITDLSPIVRFYYRFAEALAASQINEMLNEMKKITESMAGGSFEVKAKEYANKLIDENAGKEWEYQAARERIDTEIEALQASLQQYLLMTTYTAQEQTS